MRDDVISAIVTTLYATQGDGEQWREVAARHAATPEEITESFHRYEGIMSHGKAGHPKKDDLKAEPLQIGSGIRLADAFLWIGTAFILVGVIGFAFLDWNILDVTERVASVVIPNIILAGIAIWAYRGNTRYGYIAIVMQCLTWLMLPLTVGVILSNSSNPFDSDLITAFSLLIPSILYIWGIFAIKPRALSLVFAAAATSIGGSLLIQHPTSYPWDSAIINAVAILVALFVALVAFLTWLVQYTPVAKKDATLQRTSIILSSILFVISTPLIYSSIISLNDITAGPTWIAAIMMPALAGLATYVLFRKPTSALSNGVAQRILIIGSGLALIGMGGISGLFDNLISANSFAFILAGVVYIVVGSYAQVKIAVYTGIGIAVAGSLALIFPFLAALGTSIGFFIVGILAIAISAYVSKRHIHPASTANKGNDLWLLSDTTFSELQRTENIHLHLSIGRLILWVVVGGLLIGLLVSFLHNQQNHITQARTKDAEMSLSGFSWRVTTASTTVTSPDPALHPLVTTVIYAPRAGFYSVDCVEYIATDVTSPEQTYTGVPAEDIEYSVNGTAISNIGDLSLNAGDNQVTILTKSTMPPSSLVAGCQASTYSEQRTTLGMQNLSYIPLYTKDATQDMNYAYTSTGDGTYTVGPANTNYSDLSGYQSPHYVFKGNY